MNETSSILLLLILIIAIINTQRFQAVLAVIKS